MIDTVKLGIPLTRYQLEKINRQLRHDGGWQWVQHQPTTGEIRFLRVKGSTELDRPSFHREIVWFVPDHYNPEECCLVVELSVPKFWYGHNIYLLYEFVDALRELKRRFEKQLHCKFVDVLEWELFRLDICYAWKAPSQRIARQILDSLTHLQYPRKKPVIHVGETIMFVGRTYSFKFYLKLPEFLRHDYKVLKKQKASDDWIEYLEKLAHGVLRCEATLRRQYLKARKIKTIGHLVESTTSIELGQDFIDLNPKAIENEFQFHIASVAAISYILYERHDIHLEEDIVKQANERIKFGKITPIEGTQTYETPPMILNFGDFEHKHNGGSFTIKKTGKAVTMLQYFIERFIGGIKGMDTADQVKAKLLEKYKPNKAGRLLGFWMHVQRFGSQDAKEIYGKDSFYDAKSDLKKAEISLIEPPKVLDDVGKFLEKFSLEIPSPYVTNVVDDYRESGNLLNLPKDNDKEMDKNE